MRGSFDHSRTAFEKLKFGRVAFMGGSITEMNGYRPMVMNFLERKYPKAQFEFINAGISSTCSTTGAFRLQRDILTKGPIDLFFLEFAVNDDQDAGHDREGCIRGMEGIIRQFRSYFPKSDIVVTYFVNPRMLELLKVGKIPLTMAAHEEVLEKYQISGVHLARELAEQINKNEFSWEKFGGTHPKESGNRLCADMHAELLHKAWTGPMPKKVIAHKLPNEMIDPLSYANGKFLSPGKIKLTKGWSYSEPNWQKLHGSKRTRYLGSSLLHSNGIAHPLSLKFSGSAIGAFILAGPDAAKLRYSIDGQKNKEIDLFHHYSKSLHYPRTVMFAHDLSPGEHTLTIVPIKHNQRNAVRIMEFCINQN